MSKPVKVAASFLGILFVCLAICWEAGFVEFTYPNVVPNEPLLHPLKVRQLDGTNMLLENGQILALSPLHSSDRSTDEIFLDVSNQVRRSDFEVDVERKNGERVEVYVRWPRKFRDSVPPFTIPIIRETVGRKYRKPLAFGTYVNTNSQPSPTRTVPNAPVPP
jgi:hypothetical protein